ncbi:hypothetical protein HY468_04960 [Candidatus Roizmanbacteria bacterium]|nr:hypothetical protein [Candidatus Roizmanbacteria bacterium]
MQPIQLKPRDYKQTVRALLATEEVQAYTMAILSFFALAFFTLFAIKPTLTSFFQLQRQIEDSKEIDRKLEMKIGALLQAQELYQQHQTDIELLDKALPSEPQFTEFLQKVERLVVENESTISAFASHDFSFLPPERIVNEQGKPKAVDFTFTARAPFPENEQVLKTLMRLKRVVLLKNITFAKTELTEEKKQGTASLDDIDLSIGAGAYYLTYE